MGCPVSVFNKIDCVITVPHWITRNTWKVTKPYPGSSLSVAKHHFQSLIYLFVFEQKLCNDCFVQDIPFKLCGHFDSICKYGDNVVWRGVVSCHVVPCHFIRSGSATDRRTLLKLGAQLDLASSYAVQRAGRTESPTSLKYAKLCVELKHTGAAIGEMWGDLAIRHIVFE